ncbi:serine threonine-protein kinase 17a [Lasius niger]|uniref:Serine threonine-protein kinase 17a n=1 Tax=Lasius niger TaxID=67767 RepID=A0A0J7L3W0_LASNI|nr:serine threonine-protein kinase 17a [Lasius niger]
MFEQPSAPLPSTTCSTSDDSPAAESATTLSPGESSPSKPLPIVNGETASNTSSTPKSSDGEKQQHRSSTTGVCHSPTESCAKPTSPRAVSSHTENLYSTSSRSSPKPIRFGLSPDRRDTFKRNMDSLARKFSGTVLPEIVIIETAARTSVNAVGGLGVAHQRRATATHTMPAGGGEVFKCTPVFILGEAEQQCSSSDSGSDTVSEISTDSSSDRSSIYSDDSLDFILYGKSQGRASYPFTAADATADRWEQQRHHRTAHRVWPRECSGVVSKALSRFTSETSSGGTKIAKIPTPPTATAAMRGGSKAGLEALRERNGNLVVIREPVRAGRYTRYSEVQCESVQARIRRLHEAS